MTALSNNIFNLTTTTVSLTSFLSCILVALISGTIIALVYSMKNKASNSFYISIAMLPAIVCVVIMMVSGNLGAGVAVAGAFSLIRFRSAPGTAKEITTIFIAMDAGLLAGMGYLQYTIFFTIIFSLILFLVSAITLHKVDSSVKKDLRITIPEDLNYSDVFDEILGQYTKSYELISVKTSNMGSLYKLHYLVEMNADVVEKEFIDALRVRNGNLEISMARHSDSNICEL